MSKRGTVILSSIRQLLGRSHHVRQFERSGLRLTPVTTSFVTLHRKFASSTNSSDDEQKKLEKHKKETASSEVRSVVSKSKNQNENEIKVVWEYCDNCESKKLKDCKNLECKHRPGDALAIRAENFTKNQKHKLMMDNYEAYKKKLELEQIRDKLDQEVQATDVKVALQQKLNRFKKWKANKRKSGNNLNLINKMVWNVFKRKKASQKNVATKTQVKKFHIMAMNQFQKKSKDV